METSYDCPKCQERHDIHSTIGVKHLKHVLSPRDIETFINLSTTIPTYEMITGGVPPLFEGTHDFIREVKIAQTLQDKFLNMEAYHSADGFKGWLTERMQHSNQAAANALSRIQGDSAGEVDFVSEMQGNIRSLFTKTDFVRNEDGRITSNHPGIDAIEISRITGEVVNEYQVKTLRSADSIEATLNDFLANEHYKPTVTLVGPQELIDRAREQGIPNPTKVMGTLNDNLDSANELSQKILNSQMAVSMTPGAVTMEILGGTAIGSAISVTVSGLMTYLQYKKGIISFGDMKRKLGKDGVKGTVTGSALAGLSLFIPGGLIGAGIGFTVGVTLRRLLDEAYGEGMFGQVLDTTKAVHANVELVSKGSVYVATIAKMNGEALSRAISTVNDMAKDRYQADSIFDRLEKRDGRTLSLVESRSADSIFSKLDNYRNKLLGR